MVRFDLRDLFRGRTPQERVDGRSERQMGLLLLSTRRVLFRPHGELAEPPAATFPLAELVDADFQNGSMTGRVRLRFPGRVLEVDKLLGRLAEQLVTAIGAEQAAQQQQVADGAIGAPRDPLQELVELRSRYTAGDISTADYEAAKARLVREL